MHLRSSVILTALLAIGSGVGIASTDPSDGCGVASKGPRQGTESFAADDYGHVGLRGEVPIEDYPDIQRKADAIWYHLVHRFRILDYVPMPEIRFHPFNREMQSGDWTAWQKTWTRTHPVIWRDWTALRERGSTVEISQDWIDRNIDEIFPFPASFLAFHYDGTNRIQINPDRTFRASIQRDPYGERRDMDGRGYYSMAHEMLHYALEVAGVVPTKLHHCLMLFGGVDQDGPGIMEQVADYLVEDRIIAPSSRLLGLRAERTLAPCRRLAADELRRVAEVHARLGDAVTDPVRGRVLPAP